MIIKCPNCGFRYELQRRPPATFHCRKCSFTIPFQIVLNEQNTKLSMDVTNSDGNITGDSTVVVPTSNDTNLGNKTEIVSIPESDHTKVVPGLGDKTRVVQSLQQKRGVLQVSFNNHPFSTIPLPFGNYELGRLSSDSNAKVKITPDLSMSRIHAGMRTIKMNGQIVYQITSVKDENPVYVNNQPIKKGKAYSLKNGDQIKMGDTTMLFRLI